MKGSKTEGDGEGKEESLLFTWMEGWREGNQGSILLSSKIDLPSLEGDEEKNSKRPLSFFSS